jgi:uncharacterized protein YjbI with pentapeptide repeats
MRLPVERHGLAVCAALVLAIATGAAAQTPAVEQVTIGPNVNMVGGPASFEPPSTLVGDPFLQRQNEPSLAVSSRNPCHLLGGANDYRAVDLEEAAGEIGDAWLGLFKSFDCGATWTSTLFPGHPVDVTPEGLASPLKGLQAAADPTVRAGTNGLFYYSGIAFNRGEGAIGKVFVSRFVDNNNKDGGDPIQYLGTAQISVGTSGQFLDKPWLIADIARDTATCVINGRTVPAGNVYLVYATFLGNGNNVHTNIMFSRSTDCGATWSNPSKLSEQVARNQGAAIAVDPGNGAIHVAWREFAIAGDSKTRNAIIVVRSTDGGRSFTKSTNIGTGGYVMQPFDQASSPITFRTNAYPTIAVVPAEAEGRAAGQAGRVYVAWSARGFAPVRPGQTQGDTRVVVSKSIGGISWSAPAAIDSYPGAGHQIMPALAFAGGKVALVYYDLREDRSLGFDDLVVEYGQAALTACMSQSVFGFGAVLACMADPGNVIALTRRHTLDVRASMADALCLSAGTCALTSYSVVGGGSRRVSRYIEGFVSSTAGRQQLQYNRPNLPLFSRGRFPFIGDYIDIAGQSFVALPNGQFAWNTGLAANRPAPVFHVAWADNRNVGSPRDLNWERFTPAVLGPNMVQCVPGQAGVRNQDVYTAQLKPGLVVSAPHNSKRVVGLQRSFVVVTQNTTGQERDYTLTLTPPAGVIASFSQFLGFDGASSSVLDIQVRIPRGSGVARTVYVALQNPSTDPNSSADIVVPVLVAEVTLGSGGVPTPTGVRDTVYLNPDFENPDFENPDFENAELHNPDFENPDFQNPDFENPDFENFTLSASSSIRNPDFENPDFENPDFENPDFQNPDFQNPDFENPDFENPDFENPDFENPDFENPDFENPDFQNGAFEVADITWPVRNKGNTTSAYKANVFVSNPPAGVAYQLVVRRVYASPASVCALPSSTSPASWAQNQAAVNIVGPNIHSNLFDRDFNNSSRDNATFYLSPGERASITLRAYCEQGAGDCTRDLVAELEGSVALGVVAQSANCTTCVGAGCSLVDLVTGPTECLIDDGPPKDIYDPIPPTIALLPPALPIVTDEDGNGSEPVTFRLSAVDNVAISSVSCVAEGITIALTDTSDEEYTFSGNFPVGTTSVTCSASDVRTSPSPNSASVSFDVVVLDVTPPTFDLSDNPGAPFVPGNPAEATGPGGAIVFFTTPTATDSHGAPASVTCASLGGLVSGATFPIGVTPILCAATSESGVSTDPTALFSVSVVDTTAPSLFLPAELSAEATGPAGAQVAYEVSATDLVDPSPTIACSAASNSAFPVGKTDVVCTATDDSGNVATRSLHIKINDTAPPHTLTASLATDLPERFGGALIRVAITGIAKDLVSNVRVEWIVTDEYGEDQPVGHIGVSGSGAYETAFLLQNTVREGDTDGRHYTIRLIGGDASGNVVELSPPLSVIIGGSGQ